MQKSFPVSIPLVESQCLKLQPIHGFEAASIMFVFVLIVVSAYSEQCGKEGEWERLMKESS